MHDDDITIWDCPKCTGKLIKRINKLTKQSFLGCTNYPECPYTQQAEATDEGIAPPDAASVWE
jgi:ssDNA-binding Zn-finger/Zn-ribbon topoisomerase 1